MIKKRKNVQFFAAAAITAALVTGQFSFATVMGDTTGTVSVQAGSVIPDNVTVEKPVPLSDIALPASDYGTLSWADPSSVPNARVQAYDVVFHPYNKADLVKIAGWDGKSDVIYGSVNVVVSIFSNDTEQDESAASDKTEAADTTETPEKTDSADADTVPETTENKSGETTESGETAAEITETPTVTAVPSENENTEEPKEDAAEATPSPEATAAPETTTPEVTQIPEATVTPEADRENIFDGEEQTIAKDERSQTAETDPSEEEQTQIAETNHTCNGISVSGINLPWYVQFRVASGDKYEFTNEADANVFKAYEFELWDLKNNTEYKIPDGEYLSVTVPVKAGYDYTIEHLLDSGAMETIVPSVEGSTMVFSTHSFSPFGIAGSKALVGEEIEDGSYSSGSTTSDTQVTSVPTAAVTSTASTAGSTGTNTTVTASASGSSDSSADQASNASEADTSGNSVGAVSTGDNTPILPFVLLGAAAVVIIGVIVFLRKRK